MDINLSKNLNIGAPKAQNSRNSIIEVVLLVLVCGLFTWFIILPKNAEVGAKETSLNAVQQQQTTMAGDLTKLQGMVQTLNSSPADVADLDQALPLDGNTVELQILINNLAQSVGVTVGDVEVSSSDPDPVAAGDKDLLSNPYAAPRTLQTLSGTVLVTGSFSQLQAFLQKLETSARIIDVTDLEIDAGPGGDLNLKLGLNAYYLGAQTAP